jgi:hypothetical protein
MSVCRYDYHLLCEWTYSVKSPSTKHSLRSGCRVPAVSLQVVCYVSPAELREHLRYLVDLGGVHGWGGSLRAGMRACCSGLAEVPSCDEEADDEEDDHLGDVDGLFCHFGGRGAVARWVVVCRDW